MLTKHPSGRPIRTPRVVGPSIWRIPERGPVIPRLQPEDRKTTAIGFHALIASELQDDD